MKKICVVTGSRADYGLLYWLLKEINTDKKLELQLIATGMHMNEEFGSTYKIIEEDFSITQKIPMQLDSDSAESISIAMGKAQIIFAKTYSKIKPDLLVLLGDRYEILSAAIPAVIANIPIAHLHGGETSEGAFDEVIRHALTKMSHLHFCASDIYKNRIIQLGEQPSRVFNVGALGLDNIKKLKLLSKEKFQKAIDFSLAQKNILVTYHPETLTKQSSKEQFSELLQALTRLQNTHIIFTKTNSDTDGKIINSMIDDYVSLHPTTCVSFISLGQLRYLSTLKYVDLVLGNSSSGLLEVPSFHIPTIDVGDRQKGRIHAQSVISCVCETSAIKKAIKKAYSSDFRKKCESVQSPFGTAGASKKIKKIIKKTDLKNLLEKKFYDIAF
jgi:GDP/UDP-N,N'-diacetylbacillosamine 2-epimerase (hydrolysing)